MSTFELSSFDEPSFRRELLVVASFLAGYGTSTRTGYATDQRMFAEWCRSNGLYLFEVQRSRTLGLDRTELSAFMIQAGIGPSREHALRRCWPSTGCGCRKR